MPVLFTPIDSNTKNIHDIIGDTSYEAERTEPDHQKRKPHFHQLG